MIKLANIHKTYRLGEVDVLALRGVSLHIADGDFVAIVGQSGSGKSTLMHILGLLDSPDKGTYELDGRDVSALAEDELAARRSRLIGFVFQQFNLLAKVPARENVALPLIYGGSADHDTPEAVLQRVGLGSRMNHTPGELSGGEQQRVAIARALVNKPRILMADEPTGNLDTRNSKEIMALLTDLNRGGLTVIVVTHDPEVATHARRVITIRDGGIVDDRETRPFEARKVDAGSPAAKDKAISILLHRWREVSSLFRQAVRSLVSHKTRTGLSMLGVLIGVAAVIAMLALGKGAKIAVEERISMMGANLLVLRTGHIESRGVSIGAGGVSRLTLADADALKSQLKSLKEVSPVARGTGQVTYGGKNWRTSVIGTSPGYAPMHDLDPQFGRFFTDEEVLSRARVAVIGLTISREMFGEASPLGKTIRINKVGFTVLGILPDKGSSFHFDMNDMILVPVTTAMWRMFGKKYVDNIEMQVISADQLPYTEAAAVDLALRRHGMDSSQKEAYEVRNLADIQSAIAATGKTMAMLLAGIGAISLLVGGIGIMNIMLVSVTERTHEIGIRKAVGARRADILIQFLIESVAVSAFGGVVGILIGWGASQAMSKLAGWTVSLSIPTVVIAFVFSAVVGIVFGLWPAQKAARLRPIDALRYE